MGSKVILPQDILGPRPEHAHGDDGCFEICPVWGYDRRLETLEAYQNQGDGRARLNELSHVVDNALERIYRIDREYAHMVVRRQIEFYSVPKAK